MRSLSMSVAVVAVGVCAMGAAFSACAQVIGADDYKVLAADGGQEGGTGGHVGTGGSSSTGGNPGTGGSAGTGGSVAPDGGFIPTSGQTLCDTSCPDGLQCEHSSLGTTGICAQRCPTANDCDSDHDCIGGKDNDFAYSCLVKCPTGTCPDGFRCMLVNSGDDAGTELSDCLPIEWFPYDDGGTPEASEDSGVAPDGGVLGIGDPCTYDTDCQSGICVSNDGSTVRWCSRVCNVSSDCAGSGPGGTNVSGSTNGCYVYDGSNGARSCFRECDTDTTVCNVFTGIECLAGNYRADETTTTHSVCAVPPAAVDGGT